MTQLGSYYLPGMQVNEFSIPVPLSWEGLEPGDSVASTQQISLFYRVLSAPEYIHQDLPLLVYLQGGPGGPSPRPVSASSEPWIAAALQHFRIVLPDQRGTGRSTMIDGSRLSRVGSGDPGQQADYLSHFLADSIVRDFEHLRITQFHGRQWVSLGQSYGGFLTLAYLSAFPQGLAACFTTGGIPHLPAQAKEVYQHTFPRMKAKTQAFYQRYPQDQERVAAIAERLSQGDVYLPNGDPLSPERLQSLGVDFGMQASFERLHWLLDTAVASSDGSLPAATNLELSDPFLEAVQAATGSHPLYWPLQEFIYADGSCGPIHWAAQQVRESLPEFSPTARPMLFTGEAIFPWMFEQEQALRPFKEAVELLMERDTWPQVYDRDQLAHNEVPLQAAVYYDDMYVDAKLQLDTLSHIGHAHAWVTNEFEHDGIHQGPVFSKLFQEALSRGDLESIAAGVR